MKTNRSALFLLIICTVISTFSSCKKHIYGVLGESLVDDFSFTKLRPTGIACNTTDSLMTFEDGYVSFSNDHILCIEIEMEPAEFEIMRRETRFGPSTLDKDGNTVIATFFEYLPQCDVPWPDHYNWYSANMRIDGQQMDQVGIRKKGFLGSVFSVAPSIKLKTDYFVNGQRFGKSQNITLNNNAEDPTRMRMIYNLKLFEKMNYAAPRANLANVSVNGEWLGAYTHLEAIDDDFLKRAFGNSNGQLYEGQLADFIDNNLTRWDMKNEASTTSLEPLANIARVVQTSSDENLVNELRLYLDLEKFVDFWALEAFLGHEDGYTSNRNNFLIYFDPNDNNRGHFIPWGLNYAHNEEVETRTLNPFLMATLPRRLSRIPEMAALFEARMQFILDEVWDEEEILAWFDEYVPQVESAQTDELYDVFFTEMKDWVSGRRSRVEQWLLDGLPQANAGVNKDCLF